MTYFQHFRAWRAAFLDLIELEQSEEIRSRGVETAHGPYYEHTQTKTKDADKAGLELEHRARLSSHRR